MTPSTARTQPRVYRSRAGASRRAAVRRRRLVALLAVAAVAGLAALWFGAGERALREITLPLRHEDIIRQQARLKGLDPALVAAIIYQESKFRPRRSKAGAEGLMQILPSTARFIAKRSGGTAFVPSDLGTPQVNIAYGTYYLRYLLNRYGKKAVAVAAYNAGETNVDRWLRRAGGARRFTKADIPFPETRARGTSTAGSSAIPGWPRTRSRSPRRGRT
jgi:soluble lytic murein transglycosylase